MMSDNSIVKMWFLAAAVLVRLCSAQQAGWVAGEINTTMCYWQTPRAGVVRDALYIDGGELWWQQGMSDGTYGSPYSDGNPLGLVWVLNFSTPFHTSDNISSVFTTISKPGTGQAANNIAPNYYDGAMLTNDGEWAIYGGLLGLTDAFSPPDEDSYGIYQLYEYGAARTFNPGYVLKTLPTDVTRYVTDGAAVSVPSENLGFVFGGLRAADYGPIYYLPPPQNESVNADILSLTMMELDMSVQQQEKWTNHTLPSFVPGRASAEIVWVPVSEKGVLIAIGGAVFPVYATTDQANNASAIAQSQKISPTFLSTVSVYDIENDLWYEQPTSGAPGNALAQGCAVVASAQDGSSHNIYWYGGFDGLNATGTFNDDVWILSVPSFMWMKVTPGTAGNGRAGHRCAKPYPDQMMVIGGFASLTGLVPQCVEGGLIRIFNLSSAEWIDSYNPEVWAPYTVPEMISNMIGGGPTGGATENAPTGGFANSSMTSLFGTAYNATKIANWYPYQTSSPPNSSLPPVPTVISKGSGTPSYLAPVLGVVLGLFFLTLVVLAILLWRRRRNFRAAGTATSESGTLDNTRWVSTWLRGTPAEAVDAKALTETTVETPASPSEYPEHPHENLSEVANTQLHEMPDTSQPVELHDTGFVAISGVKKTSSNRFSAESVASEASDISGFSGNSQPIRPSPSPLGAVARTDSERARAAADGRVASDVSNVSELDRGHLRGVSDTSVSTVGNGMSATLGRPSTEIINSPGSPIPDTPTLGLQEHRIASPRRSNFEERIEEGVELDELGGGRSK